MSKEAHVKRLMEPRVREALEDTPVVLITGPRQAGKTTLVRRLAGQGLDYLTLDDATTLAAAVADPAGFVRGLDRAVIDEVQRAPALLVAIKKSVDEDRRPGRFLLTGSANVMTLPKVADSLAGRMETLPLLPLSQKELSGAGGDWLASAFAGRAPAVAEAMVGEELVEAVLAGGYPEVLSRPSPRRRAAWLRQYVDALIQRDLREIANINKMESLPRFLRAMATVSGQLCNYSKIGGQVGLGHPTVNTYMAFFEQLFLLQRVEPWASNRLKRIVKTPKLHFLDSGLLAYLLGLNVEKARRDRVTFGNVLESFVYGELRKQAAFSGADYRLFHYRDRHGLEIDFILEDERGALVAVEVKASATVTPADFNGIRRLASAGGDGPVLGMVLYDGAETLSFGPGLYAVPLSSLWMEPK